MNEYNTIIGIDLGDKLSLFTALDRASGEVVQNGSLRTTKSALSRAFGGWEPSLFAIEACGHSSWVSEHLAGMGHEVLVGNTRKLRCIYDTDNKSDARDADLLARLARSEPKLLYPICHRGPEAQRHLAVLKARDAVVQTRTKLVNHVRSVVKVFGERLPTCGTACFHSKAGKELPEGLRPALAPLVDLIEKLTEEIRVYDKKIEALCKHYPAAELLMSTPSIGPITAMAYLLTLEFPERFENSRNVPAHLGLTPRRDQSGDTDKQLRITKAGNAFLRRLLVGAAQYTLGPFCKDSELRRWGLRLAERGGKNAKKRAVVAVARKLAVLLHRLWLNGMLFEPFPNTTSAESVSDSPAEAENVAIPPSPSPAYG